MSATRTRHGRGTDDLDVVMPEHGYDWVVVPCGNCGAQGLIGGWPCPYCEGDDPGSQLVMRCTECGGLGGEQPRPAEGTPLCTCPSERPEWE